MATSTASLILDGLQVLEGLTDAKHSNGGIVTTVKGQLLRGSKSLEIALAILRECHYTKCEKIESLLCQYDEYGRRLREKAGSASFLSNLNPVTWIESHKLANQCEEFLTQVMEEKKREGIMHRSTAAGLWGK